MANELEKRLLKELYRFKEINHNTENLDEQMLGNLGMSSGFIAKQGNSDTLKKFNTRQSEMAEQEEGDEIDMEMEDEEIPTDPDAEGEEIAIDDETEMDTGDEEITDVDIDTEEIPAEDETELDVTELVTKQDEVNTELADQKDILQKNTDSLDDLMAKLGALETHLSSMDDMVSKINSLETKIDEYRPKTEEEKLGLRKHDSGPFDKTLSDFFTDKEEVFDKTGKKQYILTPEEVENYSKDDVSKSFDPTQSEQ